MLTRKVAIVGMGCVSPWGLDVPAFCCNVKQALAADFKIRQRIEGFNFSSDQDGRISPYLDIAGQYLLGAVEEALADAKLSTHLLKGNGKAGVIIGTTFGVLVSHQKYIERLVNTGIGSPLAFQQTAHNILSGIISYKYGIIGYNTTLINGWTAGLDALILGSQLISANQLDYVIVGGVDILNQTVLDYYKELALCGYAGANFTPAEGCGVVILKGIEVMERGEQSSKGFLLATEQGGFTDQQEAKEGFMKLISRLPGEGVYFSNLNGTKLDEVEEQGIKGSALSRVIRLKRVIGECGAASGILQVIYGLYSGCKQMMVININDIAQYSMVMLQGVENGGY